MVKEKLMERYDWQQRTELLLGEEKMERIRNAHVLVVGLGGVGAYAAEMICRAGVGRMTIVDADTVQPTNMNRQLPAMHSTLGRTKAEVLAARYKDINPAIELTVLPVYLKEEIFVEDIDFTFGKIRRSSPYILIEISYFISMRIRHAVGAD